MQPLKPLVFVRMTWKSTVGEGSLCRLVPPIISRHPIPDLHGSSSSKETRPVPAMTITRQLAAKQIALTTELHATPPEAPSRATLLSRVAS